MKVLIIGGGIIGMTCAWRLADAGVDVEVFEGRGCGQGATHASLGALWPASPLSVGPLQELHRESLWRFEKYAEEIQAESEMPVTFRRLGRIEILNSEKGVVRAHAEAEAADATWPDFAAPAPTMQVFTPKDLKEYQPELSSTAHGALMCRATAQVNVPQLVTALRMACTRAGVVIHEHKPVQSLEDADGKLAAVRVGTDYFYADAFLVAAGAWTPLISPLVARFGGQVTVRPVKGQGAALRPPEGLRLHSIVKSGTVYLIPWHFRESTGLPDEILVGATTEPEAGYDETPTDDALHALLNAAYTLLPVLRNGEVLRQWTGLRPQNPRKPHPPIMGPHPSLPNLYLCTGHYKTGIGLAPIVADLMSELILNEKMPPALEPFRPTLLEMQGSHETGVHDAHDSMHG